MNGGTTKSLAGSSLNDVLDSQRKSLTPRYLNLFFYLNPVLALKAHPP